VRCLNIIYSNSSSSSSSSSSWLLHGCQGQVHCAQYRQLAAAGRWC
jgi:hypothetical protein